MGEGKLERARKELAHASKLEGIRLVKSELRKLRPFEAKRHESLNRYFRELWNKAVAAATRKVV